MTASGDERLVNGVFMGGGAKAIAYLGAVRAIEERGMWFGSVAGSSAGAIAATLIAAGMRPAELDAAMPRILAAVRTPLGGRVARAVVGHATSLFEGSGLRSIIDATVADQLGDTGERPVTFARLHDATGVELYVVTMDLTTGTPVVFNRRTTPNVEVAGAVAASAAIPGAFPAGRVVLDSPVEGSVVRRLIDGSAYANLPTFVFGDQSFRTWLRGESEHDGAWSDDDRAVWAAEQRRPIVAFALGDPEPLEHRDVVGMVPLDDPGVDRRFDQGPTYTSPKRLSYLVGAVLSSDWIRLAVACALVIWLALSIATLPVAVRRYAGWLASWTGDAFGVVLMASLAVAVIAMLVAAGAIALLVLVGRLVGETLLPSLRVTLGVPLELPPWTGFGADAVAVFVPDHELSTLDFGVDATTRGRAIESARLGVGQQLERPELAARLDALFDGRPAPEVPYVRGHRPTAIDATSDRVSIPELVAVTVVAALAGVATWAATNLAGEEAIEGTLLAIVVAIAAVTAGVGYVSGRAARRAAARAHFGVSVLRARPERSSALTMLGGVALLLAAVVMSVAAMNERGTTTALAEVEQAVEVPGTVENEYVVRGELPRCADSPTWDVVTERHLRLGETVFVEPDGSCTTAELVGAVDDGRFAAAMVTGVLGAGFLTAGVRTHRWARRCRRLEELVAEWRGATT